MNRKQTMIARSEAAHDLGIVIAAIVIAGAIGLAGLAQHKPRARRAGHHEAAPMILDKTAHYDATGALLGYSGKDPGRKWTMHSRNGRTGWNWSQTTPAWLEQSTLETRVCSRCLNAVGEGQLCERCQMELMQERVQCNEVSEPPKEGE